MPEVKDIHFIDLGDIYAKVYIGPEDIKIIQLWDKLMSGTLISIDISQPFMIMDKIERAFEAARDKQRRRS